jgi:cell division septation protein DedD
MSDVSIPSYRVSRASSGGGMRVLPIAGGMLAAIALTGAAVWGWGRLGGGSGAGAVPVLEPDARPIKVRPENPGGLVVANTDQLVLEPPSVRAALERQQGSNTRLAPLPESPQLDLLRREAAPPAPSGSTPPTPLPQPGSLPQPAASGGTAIGTSVTLAPPRPSESLQQAGPARTVPAATVAAPEPLRAVASLPAPSADGRGVVQLGALATEQAARAEWARLQRRVAALAGYQPQILRLDRGPEQPALWRLRVGGLADAAAARSLCEAVRGAGGACMPVPTPPGRSG